MKRFILSLLCAGLACVARAEDAPPAAAPACGGCRPAKVCVAEPATKKKVTVVYDDKCVEYCLPHCSLSLFSLFGGCCGDGGCTNCGSPRVRHVLIKRIVTEECPDVKCEVRDAAPCTAAVPGK